MLAAVGGNVSGWTIPQNFTKLLTRDKETIQPPSPTPPVSDMCSVGLSHNFPYRYLCVSWHQA